MSTVLNNPDKKFDKTMLTSLDFLIVKRNTIKNIELTSKEYVDSELDKNTVLRFNQSLEN